MVTIKNILLTTDLSPNAASAIPFAVALAKQSGGTIHLLHVFEDEAAEALASGVVIGASAWIASMRKQFETCVAELAAKIEKESGVKTIFATATGSPAKEIAKYAQKFGVDIVVTATHGRMGISHLWVGSVAERVVRISPAPVLTVRPGEKWPGETGRFERIMLATDFSENAAAAVPWALELARKSSAKILLTHVVEDSIYYASAAGSEGIGVDIEHWLEVVAADAEKRLRADATALAKKDGVEVIPILSRGRAAERLVALAVENKVNLIAIATHGYTGLSHLIFGSVAERVVRISPVPVLSIKPEKAGEDARAILS